MLVSMKVCVNGRCLCVCVVTAVVVAAAFLGNVLQHVCRHKILDADIRAWSVVVAAGQITSAEKRNWARCAA